MSPFTSDASALDIKWHKSSYSGPSSDCVETGLVSVGTAVRDSKRPNGPALVFLAGSWTPFVEEIKTNGLV